MKITQIDKAHIKEHMNNPDLYRIILYNDGQKSYGKRHDAINIRPVMHLKVEELLEAIENENHAFVLIERSI